MEGSAWEAAIHDTTKSIARSPRPRLRVDILDAPVGQHLPALDGIVVIDRVQAPDLDQFSQRRLDVAGLVGAPRLENGLAPVPSPVKGQARGGKREEGGWGRAS